MKLYTQIIIAGMFCSQLLLSQGYWSKRFAQVGTNNNVPSAIAVDNDGNVYIGGGFDYAFGVSTKYFAKWNRVSGWDSIPGQFQGSSFPIQSMAVGPNNEIYVLGNFTSVGSLTAKGIVRWTGTAWETIPGSDQLGTSLYGAKVITQGDKLYAVGSFTGGIKEYSNGTWQTVGTGIKYANSNNSVYNKALTIDQNGTLYAATYSIDIWSKEVAAIVKWNGTNWDTVANGLTGSNGGNCHINDIAVYKDTLYVVGSFISAGGKICNSVARWSGAQWDSMGVGTTSELFNVEVDDQGRVYVGGGTAPTSGSALGRISRWNGTKWEGLGPGITKSQYGQNSAINDMIIKNNILYLAGDFNQPGTVASTGAVMYDISSERWKALTGKNTNGFADGAVFAFHETKNGEIFVGGEFNYAGAVAAKKLAQWKNGHWDSLGAAAYKNSGAVRCITSDDSVVYFAGGSNIDGINSPGIIKWNGKNFVSMSGPNSPGVIKALAWFNNKLIVGGSFTTGFGTYPNGKNVYSILQWDGLKWDSLNIGLTTRTYYAGYEFINAGTVTAMASNSQEVFVGGTFDHAGPDSIINIARWNGSQWNKLGGGFLRYNKSTTSALITAMAFNGNDLYVAGKFDSIGNKAFWHLAKWNGNNWDTVSLGLKGDTYGISDMAFDVQGRLYIVGKFKVNNDNTFKYIARWNGATWERLGNLTSNFSQDMFMAKSDSKGNIYVSGYFGYTDGFSSQNFAAWINDPGIIENVKRVNTLRQPTEFSVEQNYPNPFNPATNIRYSLPAAQFVTVSIHDILGREIAVLVNENQQSGSYVVRFDAAHYAAGVYFYKVQAGKNSKTGKMLLIK